MSICKLCGADADFKGLSHIVPHFILQAAINADGKKGRDREFSIAIGKSSVSEFFGRDVSPEKIEKFLGRELTEEEAIEQKHHYGEYGIFCNNCEERLSVIEHYYAELKFSEDHKTKKTDVSMSMLFWISVIWRISIEQTSEFRLTVKEEAKLKSILNRCLDFKIQNVLKKINENITSFQNFAYLLLHIDIVGKDISTYYYPQPKQRMPYSLIIHNYVIFFYFKQSHINQLKQSLWGLEKLMDIKKINIIPDNQEKIIPIPDGDYDSYVKNLTTNVSSFLISNLIIELQQLHQLAFKFFCPEPVLQEAVSQIIENGTIHLGGQYRYSIICKCLAAAVQKHTDLYI